MHGCLGHFAVRKLVDDVVFEVDAKMITIKEGEVDIGKSVDRPIKQ